MPRRPAGRTFTRRVEDFDCAHCGAPVTGDGYTNHCPRCLWSRHVDVDPGDRAEGCRGLMAPVSAAFERDRVVLTHRCTACGSLRRNRAHAADDHDAIRPYLGRTVEA